MKRRSTETYGFVNFPVNSEDYKNSNEGGMVVKLAIIEPNGDPKFELCCGTTVWDIAEEVLVAVDSDPPPSSNHDFHDMKDIISHQKEYEEWEKRYTEEYKDITFFSPMGRCIGMILMGSTGWSGYSSTKKEHWYCTYDDLTQEGKELYNLLKRMYQHCSLHLLTFLDT